MIRKAEHVKTAFDGGLDEFLVGADGVLTAGGVRVEIVLHDVAFHMETARRTDVYRAEACPQ